MLPVNTNITLPSGICPSKHLDISQCIILFTINKVVFLTFVLIQYYYSNMSYSDLINILILQIVNSINTKSFVVVN